MARSDLYKKIIIGIGIVILIGSILAGVGLSSAYNEYYSGLKESDYFSIDSTYSEIESTANLYGFILFVVIAFIGFIFCMFFYLLSDILDHLEIISAQTTRTTKVLENQEEKDNK